VAIVIFHNNRPDWPGHLVPFIDAVESDDAAEAFGNGIRGDENDEERLADACLLNNAEISSTGG
jgi:hypothetical protein